MCLYLPQGFSLFSEASDNGQGLFFSFLGGRGNRPIFVHRLRTERESKRAKERENNDFDRKFTERSCTTHCLSTHKPDKQVLLSISSRLLGFALEKTALLVQES